MCQKSQQDKSPQQVTICDQHTKQVPLLYTFAFPGAEWWCPFCGHTEGLFGGKQVEFTADLVTEKKQWEEKTKEYLQARSRLSCSSLIWEGKRISPGELPATERDRLIGIARAYEGIMKENDSHYE